MSEITIPSSPSWYLSNILGCDEEGHVLGYGAKHELVIIKHKPGYVKAGELEPKFIPMAHKDKVNAVSFSPSGSSYGNHVVSCCDDGSVHLWDWKTLTLISSHSGHPEGQKAIGVDWSKADKNLVVSVSDLGSLVCWDLPSNTIRRLQIGTKVFPICVAACPHDKELVAIGAKSGLVVVFSVKGDGFLNFRLRGHDSDVVSLAWCPVPHNVFQREKKPEETAKTYLLASGSKSRTIYFWRAGTDGRYESFINLPLHAIATGGYRSKINVGGQGNNWVCLRWPSPTNVITSSLYGELLSYDLNEFSIENPKEPNTKKSKNKFLRLVHGNHNKGLFSIAVPTKFEEGSDPIVWTYALDKRLVACKLQSATVVADITTIGGIVYCMAVSPLDPNKLAIGCGDNKILVWNMSDETLDMNCYWNKINSKVMAVAWHPSQDAILAFGTGEGRVGILDTTGSKPAILLRLYHRKSVYSLIWEKPVIKFDNQKRKSNIALFSVGDGDILQYDPENAEKDPINLSSMFNKSDAIAMVSKSLGRSDLAWNHDKSVAAVGNDNGILYIVEGRTFEPMHTVFAHKKLVQCISWHPGSVTSENSVSPYASWLASASDNIQIMNVTESGVETVGCLNTHHERVVSLAWSPHFNARLVSASYDYTSQVWDVVSGSVLACFDGHHSAVVCCLPSSVHQDSYITGSADNTIRIWNMNKYNLIKSKSKKQRLTGVMKKFSSVQEAKDLTVVDPGSKATLGFIAAMEAKEKAAKKAIKMAPSAEVIESNAHKSKSMFPVTSTSMSVAKHTDLLWARLTGTEATKISNLSESGYLDFFGDGKSMRRLMMVEENNHRDRGNEQYARHLSLWSGNLNEIIIDACNKKMLDPWLVSLAPMVSHKLWVDCCKTYAHQLAEKGDTHMAVSYLLGVHQVEEAVEMLLDAKLFREAIAIAKSRFPSDDPIVKKALLQWSNHCVGLGMFNLAAHSLLNCGSNIEAVELLARSKDAATLALAAEIAHHTKAYEMALSLAMRSVNSSLEQNDFTTAHTTVSKHSVLKDLTVWIEMCSVIKDWETVDPEEGLPWILGEPGTEWKSLFEKATEACRRVVPSYSVLLKFLPNKPTPDSENKMWPYFCGQMSLAAAANMQQSNSKCVFKHIIQGLESTYNYYIHNPSNIKVYLQLVYWLLPSGPFSESTLYANLEENQKDAIKTFVSCTVIYWLEILNTKKLLPYETESLNLTMNSINKVVLKCAGYLFDKEILKYHTLNVEMKKLENLIASNKLKALNTGKVIKNVNEVEGEQLKNGDVNGVALHEKEESDDSAKKVAAIKEKKAKFEAERISAPNPYITFCTLRNLLNSIISLNCDSFKETLSEVTKMWEKATEE